jgi:cyclopropane fatty-acyl-phospholipid synthase-like methyltransferase
MNNQEFYNLLASNYDEMIDFEQSIRNKIEHLKNFIEPEYKTGLDLGCGTGTDSIALSKLGLKITAFDHSIEMIKKARLNAKNFGAEINFTERKLTEIMLGEDNFDFIVSLGNTLANLSSKNLDTLFNKLGKAITQNGKILIQIINYEKFPNSGNFIIGKLDNNKVSITRRYKFNDNEVNFIIDIIDKKKNLAHSLITKIFPHSLKFLTESALNNELNFEFFGNLKKESYFKEKSQNIVMVISK